VYKQYTYNNSSDDNNSVQDREATKLHSGTTL